MTKKNTALMLIIAKGLGFKRIFGSKKADPLITSDLIDITNL